jgi:predicted ATPase
LATRHFSFDFPPGEHAAHLYRYNPQVFVAPAWDEIYCTDEERTLPFSAACKFGDDLRVIYKRFDYTLIDLPCVSVDQRADFVLDRLKVS